MSDTLEADSTPDASSSAATPAPADPPAAADASGQESAGTTAAAQPNGGDAGSSGQTLSQEHYDWTSQFCGVQVSQPGSGDGASTGSSAPGGFLSSIADSAKSLASKASDAVGSVVDKAKEIGGDIEDTAKAAYDKAGEVVDKVEDTAKEIGGKIEDGAKAAYDKAGEVVDKVEDTAKEIGGKIEDGAKAAYDKAGEVVDKVEDEAKAAYDKAGEIVDKVEDKAKEIGGKIEDEAKAAYDKAGEIVDKVEDEAKAAYDKAGEIVDKVEDKAKEIGGKIEDEAKAAYDKAGEIVDKVEDKAKEIGGDIVDAGKSVLKKAGGIIDDAKQAIKDWWDDGESSAKAMPPLPRGDAGPVQQKRADKALGDMSDDDKQKVQKIMDGASPDAKKYLTKALASKHSAAEIEEFSKKIAGKDQKWMDENLHLVGLSDGKGIKQQWADSCVPTTMEAMKGELDPMYALKMHEDNPDVTAADEHDGTKKNPNMAQDQKTDLEGHGGVAKPRDGSGTGLDMGAYLDDQKDKVGLKFEGQNVDGDDSALNKGLNQAEKALKSGLPVPIRIGGDGGGHAILMTGVDDGPPRRFTFNDPYDGKTVTYTEEQIKKKQMNIAGWSKMTDIYQPSDAGK